MRSLLATVVALVLVPQIAEACQRCGRSPCRFVAHHVAPVVQQVIQQTPPVYVVQNNYPSPLVAGGSTGYVSTGGYQSSTLPLFDPDRYLSARIELKKADALYGAQDSQQLNALVDRMATLQAPAVERLAAGQAASMVLQAAGLDPSNKSATLQSSAVVIRRDASGGVQVQPLTQTQVESLTASVTVGGAGSTPLPQIPQARPPLGKFPLLGKFCGACHGTDVAAPKGGFFLGDDDNVARSMRERFFDIVDTIDGKRMPPANSAQPTDAERAGILNEVQSIIKARKVVP